MESSSDAPPEERPAGEPSSLSETIPDDSLLIQPSEAPAIVGSPEVFFPHEQLDWNIGREMENLQANMVIDLARIQGGTFSPIIILNNLNNQPEVVTESNPETARPIEEFEDVLVRIESPQPTEQLADGPAAEQSVARSTRSSTRSTPGSTPKRKKRKRTEAPAKASPPPLPKQEDDDDGLICSICFAEWTMTGDHRVVSLKCGHLFGMSCIKRWLQDNPVVSRCCATCKAKAKLADIRFIYGRAVKAIDNTREVELLQELECEKAKSNQLKLKLHVTAQELSEVRQLLTRMESQLAEMKHTGMGQQDQERLLPYKYVLTMEKNFLIGPDAGCRAIVWANNHKTLLISQKSNQPLFPGYAIRLLQLEVISSGRTSQTMIHVGSKCVRDIALDVTNNLFTCATMEKTAKFYSLVTRTLQFSITPDQDSVIWACAFDRVRPYIVYLGTQRGMVFVYDIRETANYLHVYPVGHILGDQTAVIRICPVEATAIIPHGGFLVCKLKSVWFYEYKVAEEVGNAAPTPLNISGTFSSMSYNTDSGFLLIGIRPMPNVPSSLVLGTLVKNVPGTDVFSLQILYRFEGSRVQTVMQRSAQILLNNTDTLVVAYLEDSKTLATWCTNKGSTFMQQIPLTDTVLDICAITGPHGESYLVTLSDSRCRIFKVNSDKLIK